MRSASTTIALIVSLILATAPAFEVHAQEPDPEPGLAPPPEPDPTPTSFYLLAGGGVSLIGDTDVTANGVATSIETKLGYGSIAAFGVDFGDNVRTELEFGYRRLGIDSIGNSTGTGNITALSAMGNLVFDFTNDSPITPYAGLGLGATRIDHHNVSPVSGSRLNDGGYVLALQGLAGVSLKISNSVSLFTDYRYISVADTKLTNDDGARFDGAFSDHRFTLGLRWSFGGPGQKKIGKLNR